MAATSGVIEGGLLILYVSSKAIAKSTSHSYSFSMSPRDITNKDSAGWVQILPGNGSGEVSGDGLYTFEDTYGYSYLFGLLKNKTLVTLVMARTTPKNAGDKYYTASGYLTSIEMSAANEGENVTYSYSIQITGAPTEATIT